MMKGNVDYLSAIQRSLFDKSNVNVTRRAERNDFYFLICNTGYRKYSGKHCEVFLYIMLTGTSSKKRAIKSSSLALSYKPFKLLHGQ